MIIPHHHTTKQYASLLRTAVQYDVLSSCGLPVVNSFQWGTSTLVSTRTNPTIAFDSPSIHARVNVGYYLGFFLGFTRIFVSGHPILSPDNPIICLRTPHLEQYVFDLVKRISSLVLLPHPLICFFTKIHPPPFGISRLLFGDRWFHRGYVHYFELDSTLFHAVRTLVFLVLCLGSSDWLGDLVIPFWAA